MKAHRSKFALLGGVVYWQATVLNVWDLIFKATAENTISEHVG